MREGTEHSAEAVCNNKAQVFSLPSIPAVGACLYFEGYLRKLQNIKVLTEVQASTRRYKNGENWQMNCLYGRADEWDSYGDSLPGDRLKVREDGVPWTR